MKILDMIKFVLLFSQEKAALFLFHTHFLYGRQLL